MGFSVHLRASKFNEKKFSLFLDLHDLVFQCLTKQKDIDKYWQKKKWACRQTGAQSEFPSLLTYG